MYHLTLTYIPSIIFVIVAWISFLVPSDVVPGRMVLCVVTLLTLMSMFHSVRYCPFHWKNDYGIIRFWLLMFPTARRIQIVSHFQSRTLTPQVSYMKAIDLWVLGCIFFVFSTLAEFGLVLYLTSRSAWQKRVDAFIKEKKAYNNKGK